MLGGARLLGNLHVGRGLRTMRAARSAGRCRFAFSLRKPLAASNIAAAVQRSTISASRQRFTLRQTRASSQDILDDVGAGQRAAQLSRRLYSVFGLILR